jgi:predicted dehydrogenase
MAAIQQGGKMRSNSYLELNYRPELPSKHDYGIGCVGAGLIMNVAHLPAYRKAGLKVLAITDLKREAAERTAKKYEIPKVCESLDELLETPGIDILDVAIPAGANPTLAEKIFAAGKHALMQKPMAESLEEAERMVKLARKAKMKFAVNQQMRWSPSVRAAKDLLQRGWLGEPIEYRIEISIKTDWSLSPWLKKHPYPELTYHTIHYVDTVRSWFGDPQGVYATLASHPEAEYEGPTRSYLLLDYPGPLRGSILVQHYSVAAPDDYISHFTIDGTEGRCDGLIGLYLDYPAGRSDLVSLSHQRYLPKGLLRMELEGRWIPDAFLGPMGSLMRAIHEDGEPETSGAEVLGTMRLLEAAKRSHETKRCVQPSP